MSAQKSLLSPRKTIIAVNANLLGATASAFVAWLMWPNSYEWWGFGPLSIIMGLSAVLCVDRAHKVFSAYRRNVKAVDDFQKGKGQQKDNADVINDRMKQMGMRS